ncbi:winged helix-turn-helix transcriptional regulator [Nannocystis bainbridge]|uniref:Helix-turn-helix domain-containing protein n=1 Tax=Nannocystis bainbridge TaxID=2995303 RepID=A0ABT5DU81_9BACT|nr:helix-turn-helix domain-containing protein [Nannocystis bainbridge]MDC0716705.1 helix-turn-helix domain-containing protein [Nannocystis bainbridge]
MVRELMGKLGDKWSVLLVVMLAKAPGQRARFSELQRMLTGISQRVLTTTLRDAERDGFVAREVFAEVPPRVEYELTELGRSLLGPMEHLARWIGEHWPTIAAARERFDRRG